VRFGFRVLRRRTRSLARARPHMLASESSGAALAASRAHRLTCSAYVTMAAAQIRRAIE
jgi:hypothetical protein